MDSKVTVVLEILSDGKWHEVEELRQLMKLDDYEMQEITRFLNKYSFAKIDEENKKVKIEKDFQKFLAES